MAQDLRRIPTSTGNKKVFTYSCWIKRNGVSAWARLLSIMDGNTDAIIQLTNVNKLRFRDEVTGPDIDYISSRPLRDVGNWMHLLVAIDTTAIQAEHRIRMYINGDSLIEHGLDTESMPGDRNLDLQFNSKLEHRFFARNNDTEYFLGEAFDLFWVDGQALTPDVFGFYKEGDGYVSVGSTEATDFRPGQWSPHSPRKIKSEIERNGGFGVNGFYLPMNDSSNFGADFHCAPDSIITLKGEDLQQPRNGLPTTSDNYVSQLRQEVGTLGFDGVVDFSSSNTNTLQDSGDAINIGTNDFTVEAFVYHKEIPQNSLQYIFMSTAQSNTNTFAFAVESDRIIAGIYAGTWSNATKVEGALPVGSLKTGQWYHYAACRSGTTLRLFINGKMIVEDTSHTENYDNTSQYGCRVGCDNNFGASQGGAKAIRGFLSNVRVVNGTALYTSNFTPPTSALTAVPNTVLLCCQSTTDPTEAAVSPGTLSVLTNGGGLTATRNELSGSIVLAVPGVNNQPTGSELVTNGTFDTDVSGWTITDTGTIVRQSDGTAEVTRGTSAEVVYQSINTVVGTTYELSVDITAIAGSHGQIYVRSTYDGGSLDAKIGYSFYPGTFKGTFTADTTTTRIILYAHPTGSTSYDNISVKETTISEYSADIKGSGTNKTFTPASDAGIRSPHGNDGFQVHGYYGSALHLDGTGDCLVVNQSADFNLGDEDYTIEGWYYDNETAINTGSHCFWAIGGVNADGTFSLFYENNALMLRGKDVGQAYENIIYVTNHGIPVKQWNHLCVERVSGRTTLYLNGVALQTTTDTTTIAQGQFTIGAFNSGGGYAFNGWAQDVRVYKGVAKYKSGFDVPKHYNPTRSLETWRQVSDTCKNNFATFNPIFGVGRQDQQTYSNGNLRVVSGATSGSDTTAVSTIAIKGKIYCEFALTVDGLGAYVGVMKYNTALTNNGIDTTASSDCWLIRGDNEHKANGEGGSGAPYGTGTWSTGDIIMLAVDIDNASIWFGKNGTWYASGDPASNSNAAYTNLPSTEDLLVMCGDNYSSETPTIDVNFGQNPTFGGTRIAGTTYTDSNGKGLFKYQPPTGFLAMCEDNLPTPAIADPGKHFKTVLWTGINDTVKIKCGFQPDFVWIKNRDYINWHALYDSIRGPYLELNSNEPSADRDRSSADGIRSFDSDGFTSGLDDNTGGRSGDGYVAWCWKAGGSAVPNTSGSVTSQVSVNQDAGFSIVSYTGSSIAITVGHGLGKKPNMILFKNRDQADKWAVYHSSVGATKFLSLNEATAATTSSSYFSNTEPTSSVFTVNQTGPVNQNNEKYIAYCWSEIEGYSKFGSYVGNASADGTFVYCGFKPAFVITKRTDGTSNWLIHDSSRDSVNPVMGNLYANEPDVEGRGSARVDFVSNGFKHKNADGGAANNYANDYIFIAFAESPFQTANAK